VDDQRHKPVYATTDPNRVAGHVFDLLTDRCVNTKLGIQSRVCGLSRTHVHRATADDINTPAYCCVGSLNAEELAQINRDKVRVQLLRDRAYAMIALCVEAE
jgi:hypothetical protein